MSIAYVASLIDQKTEQLLLDGAAEAVTHVVDAVCEDTSKFLVFGTDTNYWMLAAVLHCFQSAMALPEFGSSEGQRLLHVAESLVLWVPAASAADTVAACVVADPRQDPADFAESLREWFEEHRPEYADTVNEGLEEFDAIVADFLASLAAAATESKGLLIVAPY